MILLFGGIIIWKIIRQSIVTIFLIEIELFTLEFITKKTIILKRFFHNLILILSNL
jgi:hypothetical protein